MRCPALGHLPPYPYGMGTLPHASRMFWRETLRLRGRPTILRRPKNDARLLPLTKEPNLPNYAIGPAGERFELPDAVEYPTELSRVVGLVGDARTHDMEIVVVMGLGFVGAVMAAIVADSTDEHGESAKFVIGCQRPSTRSYWKIPLLNRGESPVKAEDPEVAEIIRRTVVDKKTLVATFNSDCPGLADCVIVDIQLDYKKNSPEPVSGETEMSASRRP